MANRGGGPGAHAEGADEQRRPASHRRPIERVGENSRLDHDEGVSGVRPREDEAIVGGLVRRVAKDLRARGNGERGVRGASWHVAASCDVPRGPQMACTCRNCERRR